MDAGQVLAPGWLRRNRQVPELIAAPGVLLPGSPGRQKRVAQAEPGVHHRKPCLIGPASGQVAAAQVALLRLHQRAAALGAIA